MDTIWFEALHEYLQSDEWYQTIGVFIDSHAALFDPNSIPSTLPRQPASNKEMDHGHYTVYKEFVEISENILNNMLDNLGGSLELLGQALDEHASLPPSGPRDNMRKEMINLLLTFDSFPHFCSMMASKSGKQDYYDANPQPMRAARLPSYDPDDLNKLTQMGFPTDSCVNALQQSDGNFDEALQFLFDNPPPSPREEANPAPSAPAIPAHDTSSHTSDDFFRSTRPSGLHHGSSIAEIYAASFPVQCDYARTVLAESKPSHLIPWAKQAIELQEEAPRNADWTSPTPALRKALDMVQAALSRCEHSANQADIESSVSQMKKKDEDRRRRNSSLGSDLPVTSGGDTAADKATPSEKQLDYMFRRREELVTEIGEQRKKVVAYSKPGAANRISDDTLEELYLFLKEMVHNGEDLDKHKKRIHEYVFSRITSKSGSLVPCLLDLMLLENEDYLLQRNIAKLLNGESIDMNDLSAAGATSPRSQASPSYDNELDALHKANALELENSRKALEAEAERQRRKLQEQLRNKRKQRLQDAPPEEHDTISRAMADEESAALDKLDRRLADRNDRMLEGLQKKHLLVVDTFTNLKRPLNPDELDDINAQIAAELRAQHLKDLAAMRSSVDAERERQKAALQERLRKKRLQKLSNLSPNESPDDVILDIDMEETRELDQIDSKFSRQMRSLTKDPTNNFAATNMGARLNYGSASDGDGDVDWTDHLAKLHKAHCESLSTMEQSLMDEKNRQTSQLQRRLQRLRQKKLEAALKRGASAEELQQIEDECQVFEDRSRKQLEERFAEQLEEIEKGVMTRHDDEVNRLVANTDSDVLHKLAVDSAFDFESAAAALKAAHERDQKEHGEAVETEKERQAQALKEKLRKRREKKRLLLEKEGKLDQSAIDQALLDEELGFKDEQLLEEYVDKDVGKGVMRVLETRGGTRSMTRQDSVDGVGDASSWAWGAEEEKAGDRKKEILDKHSKGTAELIDRLKSGRTSSHEKLQEKLRAKRAKRLQALKDEGAGGAQVEEAEKELAEEELKERIQNDRMLTMAEHKALEELSGGAEDGEINTYELLDEIHSDFKDERENMHKQMQDEKERQKSDVARKRKERKDAKKKEQQRKDAEKRAGEKEDVLLDMSDEEEEAEDLEAAVSKIKNAHEESRQTLEMMMQMEQARQKQALQQRLMKKRAERRRNSMVALSPVQPPAGHK